VVSPLPVGSLTGPVPFTVTTFDQDHGVTARSTLLWRLAAEAYGPEYPAEIEPWGMTTWWVLGQCIAGLRVGPGQTLLDMGCGRGGPGLWLARATGGALIGVDWSPVAVEASRRGAEAFVPSGRARFVVGDLAATGLSDGIADGVVCLDAVFFATDRIAALTEVHRLLRPGGRYVFTAAEVPSPRRPFDVPDWTPLLDVAGLRVESKEEVPQFAEHVGRMYELWLANLDVLRAEIGDDAAGQLEDEALTVGARLSERKHLLVVASRPA
jgi:ubiquinone/menaquinone biosynthesis C-methylase UbiE